MTRQQFIDKHGETYRNFLTSDAGIAAINIVNSMRPPHDFAVEPHLFAENRGAIRGFELCIRNLISLSLLPKTNEEIEADYGVSDKIKPEEK